MGWSTERKTQADFAFTLACVALVTVVLFFGLRRQTADSRWVVHTREVPADLRGLSLAVTRADAAERACLITGSARSRSCAR